MLFTPTVSYVRFSSNAYLALTTSRLLYVHMLMFVFTQQSTLDARESNSTVFHKQSYVSIRLFLGICDCPVQHSKAGAVLGQGSDADATFCLATRDPVVSLKGLWSWWMKSWVNVGHEFRFYRAMFRLLELPQC